MYTHAVRARLEAMAGSDYAWAGVTSPRPPTKHASNGRPVRANFKAWLLAEQGGVCPQCGLPVDLTGEFSHMVSRGPEVKGFVPFNIAVQHSPCNTLQKERGPVVDPDTMARPDLVPGEWPYAKMGGFSLYR